MTDRVHRLTTLILITAVLFFLFFQVNKGGPFREINPFGVDPYDAVGSFAVQVALFIGLLTFARSLRLKEDSRQASKLRLIVRGSYLTLLAILVTLAADAVAEITSQGLRSAWGNFLLGELVVMYVLTLLVVIEAWIAYHHLQTEPPPASLTLADGIDDLWTLVRVPLRWAKRYFPGKLVDWLLRLDSDTIFSKFVWINPRRHAWRFAGVLGLMAGITLLLAQLTEGLPPNLRTGLLVIGIFIGAELGAVFIGYALFGGYLGLRPTFRRK